MNQSIAVVALTLLTSIVLQGQDKPRIVIDNFGHSGLVNDLTYRAQTKELISVSDDKTIRIWNLSTGSVKKTLRVDIADGPRGKIYAAALSGDGKFLAVGGFFGVREGDPRDIGSIKIINLEYGKVVGILTGHTNVVTDLAIAKDKLMLVSASADKTARIWDIDYVQYVKNVVIPKSTSTLLEDHSDVVTSIDITANGKRVVTGSRDHRVVLWDLSNMKIGNGEGVVPVNGGKVHFDAVRKVLFSPSGRSIVSGGEDGKIVIWDAYTGKLVNLYDQLPGPINTLTVSADGKSLLVMGQKGVVYDLVTKNKRRIFDAHDNTVSASIFLPFGKFEGEEGQFIASAGGDNKNILIWNTKTGKVVRDMVGQGRSVFAVVGHKKESVLAFGHKNHSLDLSLAPLQKSFNYISLNLNLENVIRSSFINRKTSHNGIEINKESETRLRYLVHPIQLVPSKDGIIRTYSFVHDNDMIAVGSTHSLKTFSRSGELKNEFMGHTGEVWALSETKDGHLISASADQTTRIWNPNTGENLASIFVGSDNEWVIWTPQGFYDASAGGEKYVGWQINKGVDALAKFHPVSAFRPKFHKPEVVRKTIELGSFEKAARDLDIQIQDVEKVLPPVIKWVSPQTIRTAVNSTRCQLKWEVSSDLDVTRLKLMLNGRPVALKKDFQISGPPTNMSITHWVTLSGTRYVGRRRGDLVSEDTKEVLVRDPEELFTFALFADNEYANSLSEERVLAYKPVSNISTNSYNDQSDDQEAVNNEGHKAEREVTILPKLKSIDEAKSNLHLISIGISNFKNPAYDLTYADDDAEAIESIFSQQEGKLFNSVNTIKILNEAATRERILSAFQNLEKFTEPSDFIVVFIASHGLNHDNQFYILPYDGNPHNPRVTCVDWRDFSDLIGNIPSQVLLMLDACHSGQLGTNVGQSGRVDNTEAVRKLSGREYGVVIMSASTGDESSLEHPDWEHGAFTYSFIEGIREGKADLKPDGTIYLRELDFFIAERVKELTGGRQHPTTQKPSSISVMRLAEF